MNTCWRCTPRAARWRRPAGQPQFITIDADGELRAAVALYLKSHSYGEYVFDWAWADAYRRHGLRYYPKLLGAVPFTPVPGSRLLAQRRHVAGAKLVRCHRPPGRRPSCRRRTCCSATTADQAAFAAAGWMLRHGVQFHWTQDERPAHGRLHRPAGADAARQAQEGPAGAARGGGPGRGLHRPRRARQIDGALWDFFYRCYTLTYQAHHSTPYLTRDFFAAHGRPTMPQHWVMFVAPSAGEPIAASP